MNAIPEGFELADDVPEGFELVDQSTNKSDQGLIESIDAGLRQIPGAPAFAEFAAGANRSVTEFIDFLGPDTANAALSLAGSDIRVPTLTESIPGIQGGFMEEGLGRDIVSSAGEIVPTALGVGGAVRTAAKALPAAASRSGLLGGAREAGEIALREGAKSTAAADVGLGLASAAGAEVGEEIGGDTGALIGSIVAPVGAASAVQGVKGLLGKGAEGVKVLAKSLDDMSDEGAGQLLAEAMVRENLSPDDLTVALKELGPDAVPADLGDSFNRLLKSAINKFPRIQGRASEVLDERQAGQAARLVNAFEDGTGTTLMSVDDEIARLNMAMAPKISSAYKDIRQGKMRISEKLMNIMSNDGTSIGRARKQAEKNLADMASIGDDVLPIDIIDETKRVIDDQVGKAIRTGEKAKAMRLTKLKRAMIDEADTAIPGYKNARDMFAGKIELENAAKAGEQFTKLNPREIAGITDGMGKSERKMFKLGAKQAIEDKLAGMQINSNAVKKLFGKGGDAEKLKSVFDTPQQYSEFRKAMEKEAQFAMTRQAAQGGSPTVKYAADLVDASNIMDDTRALMGDPAAMATKVKSVVSGLSKDKGESAFNESLEKAGDILISTNMNPDKVIELIKRGNAKQIEAALNRSVKSYQSKILAPSVKANEE
jgi:hypothetical protein